MKYTQKYIEVSKGLIEFEMFTALNYKNDRLMMEKIDIMLSDIKELIADETEVGNLVPYETTKTYKSETDKWMHTGKTQWATPENELFFTLEATKDALLQMKNFYAGETEGDNSEVKLAELLFSVTEVHSVPIYQKGEIIDVVMYHNCLIDKFIEFSKMVTLEDVKGNPLVKTAVEGMAAQISLEITETNNKEVNLRLNNLDVYEESLKKLDIFKDYNVTEWIEVNNV